MKLRTVKHAPIKGKAVLLRADLNAPLSGGSVSDDTRIRAILPTVKLLLSKKAKRIILMSHLGRPKGGYDKKYSLAPVAAHLSKLLGQRVALAKDCVDHELPDNKIVLLENLRFHPEEEKNDKKFAKKLAMHGDVFVNDAFGTMHRAHASVEAVTRYLPSYAGLLVEKEVLMLGSALAKPKRPMLAIIGGGKADKIPLVKQMIEKADTIAVLGVLGNIMLAARGEHSGKPTINRKDILAAKRFCNNPKIVLPSDAICARKPEDASSMRILPIEEIPKTHMILDCGPATMTHIHELINGSKTIFWAGTPGMYEDPHYSTGTNLIAKWMARRKAVTVTAGGDTAAAVTKLGLENAMSHVSTGGGAAVAFVEGEKLPGLAPLIK